MPFAGGSKYSYRDYEALAPAFIKVIPLEYPGRGARIKEALLGNMDEIVDDLYCQIRHRVADQPYAIYGHSMGALTALLLTRKLVANNHRAPLHLFVTGTAGPAAYSQKEQRRHLMPMPEFIQEIKKLDGIPDELLEHEELLEYIEPILRADFRVIETYTYVESEKLDVPVSVITGTREKMDAKDIQAWQVETQCAVDFLQLPGKHFFIFHYADVIMNTMVEKLTLKDQIVPL